MKKGMQMGNTRKNEAWKFLTKQMIKLSVSRKTIYRKLENKGNETNAESVQSFSKTWERK